MPTKEGASRAGLAGAEGSERDGGGLELKTLPLQTVCGEKNTGGAAQERVGGYEGATVCAKQRFLCYRR